MAGLGLRPVSDTSDRPGQQADWAGLDASCAQAGEAQSRR